MPGLLAPRMWSFAICKRILLPGTSSYPLSGVHRYAQQAAEAAEAAEAQGKFWEMHTLLFERQQALRTKDLIRYAEELTLDVERFRDELKNEKYSERVRSDFVAGVQNGSVWHSGLVSEWRPLRWRLGQRISTESSDQWE